jgi:hypothetical protein
MNVRASDPPGEGIEMLDQNLWDQATATGVLVDVTKSAKRRGFGSRVALTRAAYEACVRWTAADSNRKGVSQDEPTRLGNVLDMAVFAAARPGEGSERTFPVYRVDRDGWSWLPSHTELVLQIVPGPGAEPVIVILTVDD